MKSCVQREAIQKKWQLLSLTVRAREIVGFAGSGPIFES